MQLSDSVYRYYLDNNQLMSSDKRFHFATRMTAWSGTEETREILKELRDTITQPSQNLQTTISNILHTEQTGRRNAHALRQPFFDAYPSLYGAHLGLFRVRHLESVYGIDAREALFASMPKPDLIALEKSLLGDDEALKTLSTFAINYCYLLERVILKEEDSLPLEYLYVIGESYDTSRKEQVQLLIYFYTHCIIGETNFYTRRISLEKMPVYHKMLALLDRLIESEFTRINLDNKLEFLVCCRICGFETALSERIYAECEQSVSPEGMFIVDVHNDNAQQDRNDFIRSEHRNVLFIMSNSPYTPHSTLVKE